MTERIYDPKRLKTPLKRTGPKGAGMFEPISWDEAIETIRTRWQSLIEQEGPESILPYSFYGNMGNLTAEGMDRRFSTASVPASLTGRFAPLPVLSAINTRWAEASAPILKIQRRQNCLFLGNQRGLNQHASNHHCSKARKNGAKSS